MNDREQLFRYLGGDGAAFEVLVDRHQSALVRFATRITGCPEAAQDIVQDTFLRLLREARRLRPADNLRCWLYRVCRNLCADRARKESRMQKRLVKAAVPEVATPEPVALEVEEEQGKLRELLAELPGTEREILLLKVQHGHSYREISKITGHSLHSVATSIHRGLRRLSSQLRAAGLVELR